MKFITWLKRKENFVPIILFILAVLPFIFNLRNFFLSDDWDFLTQVANPHQPLWRYFFTNYVGTHVGGSYRPVTIWFWLLLHHFAGLNYLWYHLAQIFFHAADIVLLYLLIFNFVWPVKKEDRFALAAVSSAIFAILPNHTEAVAWLAAVSDPLCTLFYLASLLALILCLKYPRAKYWFFGGSLLFFLAALFTKEMAMSLPFIILIFVGYFLWRKRAAPIKILSVLPYLLILAGYFWLRYLSIGLFFGYYGQTHLQFGPGKTLADCAGIIVSFVFSDQLRTVISFWLSANLVSSLIIFILALAGLIYLTVKRKWPVEPWLILVALAISLVPVASFGINLTGYYFSEEGERYGYLPSIFFAILLAAGIVYLSKRISRRYLKVIFYSMLILLAVGLAGQLLIKNWRFEQAGAIAQQQLAGAVAAMKAGNYQGVLFFGLSDNFHGAPIFRNGWQEAIHFYLPQPPIILAPFNRTAVEIGNKFAVAQVATSSFNYYNIEARKLILAKPEFSSADYSTTLNNYLFEPQGINDRYFGNRLTISLSPSLASNNKIALFFWDGSQWIILTPKK